MKQEPYQYYRHLAYRYTFLSKGKTIIEKIVIFAPAPIHGIFNLGFGDLLPDGTMDDDANSNNGDILKVLATVIQILKEFTVEYPQSKIFFTGSHNCVGHCIIVFSKPIINLSAKNLPSPL